MKPCVMCGKDFDPKDLDFVGRCTAGDDNCFKKYMALPDGEKPNIGTPFSPIYNGKDKYGF